MNFSVGSLVKARGREWVVLPNADEEVLLVRPLGGSEDEISAIYLPLEEVTAAAFDLPDPDQVGDHRSAGLLRSAVRLGFRYSAGPFRSFARLAVEPRPYQLVPLLVSLKLDPVRVLIADDVGIGKTIEACLIARELLDRGEIERLAVLCPPPLAEQWQAELRQKFHIEAELVLPSTAPRLERDLPLGESLFDRFPFVVVSMDYIKSDRRREEFKRACPEFVIVDEAHTCAFGAERSGRHQRYELISGLAAHPQRHMVLVTATPHSGKEQAFRSLLSFLNKDLEQLPEELAGEHNLPHRRRLAQHFIQRRRADIRHFLDTDTPFPERLEREDTYRLGADYKRLFERVLDYARETVRDTSGEQFHQRVRWWSALALLRSLASSPAAAAETLRNRAAAADAQDLDQADEIGRRTVMDLVEDAASEGMDVIPGSDPGGELQDDQLNRRRLLEMAKSADELQGEKDEKIKKAAGLVRELLNDGYQPILFCRFIPSAHYVAEQLRERLPRDVEIIAVTGLLPPAERLDRVNQLAQAKKRVLVATDCLSEGINLQEHFNAVVHYDLSWNPTRHEQREGRVDRFGQLSPQVRTITYYGVDNQIDGVVLEVLLKKHRAIRKSLGISVPVPVNTEQVVEAIFEGLLLRGQTASQPDGLLLPGMEDFFAPQVTELYGEWDAAAEREKRSRTLFVHETIKVDEVSQELMDVRAAIGSGVDVAVFTRQALSAFGAQVSGGDPLQVSLADLSPALKEALAHAGGMPSLTERMDFYFNQQAPGDAHQLGRTHPMVEALANHVLETALDPLAGDAARYPSARRCGAMRTAAVSQRTTLLLVRFRYHILQTLNDQHKPLLAEDCRLLAFRGSPADAVWLSSDEAEKLLHVQPDANIAPEQAGDFVRRVCDQIDQLRYYLDQAAVQRGEEILNAHQRVRKAARVRATDVHIQPQLPPDVLGIFVYLPN